MGAREGEEKKMKGRKRKGKRNREVSDERKEKRNLWVGVKGGEEKEERGEGGSRREMNAEESEL